MPDLVLYNGQLHSQDPKFPQATALALRGDRILAIGQDDEILALGDGRAATINLAGRRVLPGLIDSHFHLYQWALLMRGVQLADAGSLDRVRERVERAVAAARPGEWILGRGWNQTEWPHPALPGRADLDDIAPHNPVALWRSDGHLVWVNSQTLRAAGITAEIPDPEAGIIDRDETGHPTGILRERAISLVRDVVPPPQDDELDQALQVAMVAAQRLGLTGVHDMRITDKEEGRASFRAYQRLRAEGKLGLRICMMLPVEHLGDAVALGLRSGFGDDQLYVGGVKIFADGSTGARTAWMLEPFEDAGSGLPLTRPDELAHLIGRAHEAGLATAVHAIGDRAIRELLDVFDHVLAKHPATPAPLVPHRIEHVQHGHPDDLGRLAALGLVASVQPLHIADDMVMIDRACGERARWTYAFRTLLSAGTVLAFGSDCPVAAPDPLWGIHAAVTRRRRNGTPPEGWHPEQRLNVAEAVWAYTLGSAHAGGQSAHLGSLTPGKLADLVVLDRDIFTIPYEEIAQARVCLTVFNGQVVYRSETFC